MNKFLPYIFSITVLIIGCAGEEVLLPQDYIKYINNPDNGYIQTAANTAIKMECLYKPLELEALYRTDKPNISAAQFDSLKKELDNNTYYELRIYNEKKLTGDMQMYIDYDLEKGLLLVNANKDTLKPNSYLAEPNDGVTPFRRVLFSFPEKINIENYSIVINGADSSLFSNVAFNYNTSLMKKAKLKLNE